jgi:hypothetical protein
MGNNYPRQKGATVDPGVFAVDSFLTEEDEANILRNVHRTEYKLGLHGRSSPECSGYAGEGRATVI